MKYICSFSFGQIVAREERVAFIGISNWALDPAKMNRGVMVTRGDPSEDELEYSAEGICSNQEDDPVKARLKQFFKPLSEAYMEICEGQDRQFFGLRDFYRLALSKLVIAALGASSTCVAVTFQGRELSQIA